MSDLNLGKHFENKNPNPPSRPGVYWAHVLFPSGKEGIMPILITQHESLSPWVYVLGNSTPLTWWNVKAWAEMTPPPEMDCVKQAWTENENEL